MRTTSARLVTAMRLAKQKIEDEHRHLWTPENENWYVAVPLVLIERDTRWSSAEDISVYICAEFRHVENNMDWSVFEVVRSQSL
jgi:hypothetical protein